MCCTLLAENTGRKKSPFWHHRTTLSGCIFAAEACIDNWKKNLLNTDTSSTCPHNIELRATNGWDLLASLGHPFQFQRLSRLGSVTVQHSSSGRQPNFAALNRGCHLYSAGWPSLGALADILVCYSIFLFLMQYYYSARNARIASAVLTTAIPSVRLSVHPSHVIIVSKRRHVARCSLHRWIAKCV